MKEYGLLCEDLILLDIITIYNNIGTTCENIPEERDK